MQEADKIAILGLAPIRSRGIAAMRAYARAGDMGFISQSAWVYRDALRRLHLAGTISDEAWKKEGARWNRARDRFIRIAGKVISRRNSAEAAKGEGKAGWILRGRYQEGVGEWQCPVCAGSVFASMHLTTPDDWEWRYCPFCGAKVEG